MECSMKKAKFLIALVCWLYVSPSWAARNVFTDLAALQSSLVADQLLDYWPDPDVTSSQFDHSGNGYHGTLTNVTPGYTYPSRRPYFFDFSTASSKIDMTSHLSAFSGLTDMTVFSRFIKSATAGTFNYPLFSWSHSTDANRFVYVATKDDEIVIIARDGGTTHLNATTTALGIDDDNLHDIIVEFNSSTGVDLYVDGVAQTLSYSAGSASTVINLSSYTLDTMGIGWLGYSGGNLYFEDLIDRTRIFDVILTENQRSICRTQGVAFACGGQSNMIGAYGPVLDGSGQADEPDQKIFSIRRSGSGDNNEPELAVQPMDYISPGSNVVGPAMNFCKGVLGQLSDPYDILMIIPSAQSGTGFSASDWTNGGTNDTDWDTKINVAIGHGYVLGGAIWLQGEADSQNSTETSTHLTEMGNFIDRWQADFSDYWGTTDDRLFICIEVGEFLEDHGSYSEWATINSNYASLAGSKTDVVVIDTSGLTSGGDNLHYSAASARTIGTDAATLYLSEISGGAAINPIATSIPGSALDPIRGTIP